MTENNYYEKKTETMEQKKKQLYYDLYYIVNVIYC